MAKSRRSGGAKHRKTKKNRLIRRKMKGGGVTLLPESWFKKPYDPAPSTKPTKTWIETLRGYFTGPAKVEPKVETTQNPIVQSTTVTAATAVTASNAATDKKSENDTNQGEDVKTSS